MDPVTWQSGERPIASAKLFKMTSDWVSHGLLIISSNQDWWSSAFGNGLGGITPSLYYLGWYPYDKDLHVWNRVRVEGLLNTYGGVSANLQYAFAPAGGAGSWTTMTASSGGKEWSTSCGNSTTTIYASGLTISSSFEGYFGLRVQYVSGWAAGRAIAWNVRAYLYHSSYPPF